MSLNNVSVERCDMQEIDISIDLPEVVGHHVNSPDDIKDLLLNVDDDDVAKFVIAWLNEEATSGEFIDAARHIMYASTMLNIASELIEAASQEIEDSMNGEDPLIVAKMIAEQFAKRGHTAEMQKVLSQDPDLAEALQHQLFGDHATTLREISSSLEPALEASQAILDDTSRPMADRLQAAKSIEKITGLLKSIDPKETQPTEEAA